MNLIQALGKCPIKEYEQRLSVIEEAETWLNTPFICEARVKGAGADCAQFLAGVYINAGIIEPFKVPHYPAQWHLHSSEERYLRELVHYAHEIPAPALPGDIAVFHVKRAYAHAGIIVEWPQRILHCLNRGGVQWGDASRDAFLIMEQREFPPKFFSLWNQEAKNE
jgi:cell wall-associated NlpC family hydrolase